MVRKLAVVATLVLLSAVSANAAILSFTELNNQSVVPTLDTSGIVDLAFNFTPYAGSLTSQGIAFTNNTTTSTDGNISFGSSNGITVSGSNGGAWGTADIGGDNLWHTFVWTSAPAGAQLNISGLNAAKTYKAQLLYGDTRIEGFKFNTSVTTSASDSAAGVADWSNGTDALTSIVVRGVTSLTYSTTRAYTNGWGISALVVSEIPEPMTSIMLTSGLLGLLAYAWRKRK
jgi:hypothetical protein